MLEIKSVAKSIKYCALEYCAEKSTAKLVQFFFWPIKAREFYVSNFCTVQNLTDLFFHLTKILSLVCLVTLLPTTHPLKMMNMMAIMLRQTFSTTKWTLSPFRFFFLPPALQHCLKTGANFSHINSWTVSRHRMDAHLFDLLLFHQFCELVCRDPPKYLIHSMRVILIGWLNKAVSFWRRKKKTKEH